MFDHCYSTYATIHRWQCVNAELKTDIKCRLVNAQNKILQEYRHCNKKSWSATVLSREGASGEDMITTTE